MYPFKYTPCNLIPSNFLRPTDFDLQLKISHGTKLKMSFQLTNFDSYIISLPGGYFGAKLIQLKQESRIWSLFDGESFQLLWKRIITPKKPLHEITNVLIWKIFISRLMGSPESEHHPWLNLLFFKVTPLIPLFQEGFTPATWPSLCSANIIDFLSKLIPTRH